MLKYQGYNLRLVGERDRMRGRGRFPFNFLDALVKEREMPKLQNDYLYELQTLSEH